MKSNPSYSNVTASCHVCVSVITSCTHVIDRFIQGNEDEDVFLLRSLFLQLNITVQQ